MPHETTTAPSLEIPFHLPISSLGVAGLFVSPGKWRHANRLLPDHVLIFVRTGVLHIQEEDEAFSVKPNEAILLRAGHRHFGTSDDAQGLTYFWVHFTLRDASSGEGGSALQAPRHTMVSRPERLETLFRLYIGDIVTHRENPLAAALLICQMLCEVSQPSLSHQENQEPALLANQAAAYMRSHLQDPLSTSVVADAISCNPKYLSRVYHQVYGETFTQSVHKMRIEYAKYSLIETSMTVNEIARSCGFDLTSYFIKIFRRSTGMTPGEFRRTFGRLRLNSL
jgi:AraC-like DNA-binding protein